MSPSLQRLVAGNAVADDMVDRDAAAVRVAAIAERRGDAAAAQRHLADDVVELAASSTPGTTCGTSASRISAASRPARAHAGEALGPVELDRAGRAMTVSSSVTVT